MNSKCSTLFIPLTHCIRIAPRRLEAEQIFIYQYQQCHLLHNKSFATSERHFMKYSPFQNLRSPITSRQIAKVQGPASAQLHTAGSCLQGIVTHNTNQLCPFHLGKRSATQTNCTITTLTTTMHLVKLPSKTNPPHNLYSTYHPSTPQFSQPYCRLHNTAKLINPGCNN